MSTRVDETEYRVARATVSRSSGVIGVVRGRGQHSLAGLTYSIWFVVVAPGTTALLQTGRPDQSSAGVGLNSALSGVATDLGLAAVVLSAAIYGISGPKGSSPLWMLYVLVAPWAIGATATLAAGQPFEKPSYFVYVLVVFVLWFRPPDVTQVLSSLGRLALATAALSLALAFLPGQPGLMPASDGRLVAAQEDKALIAGRLLAGPFNHSNELGIALAAGMPFVLAAKWRYRVLAVALQLFALLYTSSRTALLAASVTLLVAAMLQLRLARRTTVFAIAAWTVVVATPLATTDPESFTTRGRIWLQSRADWSSHWLLGGGQDYYSQILANANQFGRWAFHGHNLFVNSMSTAGLLGTLALAALFAVATIRAQHAGSLAFQLFVVAVAALSVLETTLDLTSVSSGLVWLLLVLGVVTQSRSICSTRPTDVIRSRAGVRIKLIGDAATMRPQYFERSRRPAALKAVEDG